MAQRVLMAGDDTLLATVEVDTRTAAEALIQVVRTGSGDEDDEATGE